MKACDFTQDFVHGADCAALKEARVDDFRAVMAWLMGRVDRMFTMLMVDQGEPRRHLTGQARRQFPSWARRRSECVYPDGVDNINPCPFCDLPDSRVLLRNDNAIAFRDAYPVSPGHTLVIPLRHVASFFDITPEERAAILSLLDSAKRQLELERRPAGYNIGINDGAAAGQTIGHLHIHLIPRYLGDRPDPRGGVRWVMPEKADYWTRRT
jgi:diadenosine tetraphosphate (Ap4A) HIT family hydrolase